jgi:hypothetical protein
MCQCCLRLVFPFNGTHRKKSHRLSKLGEMVTDEELRKFLETKAMFRKLLMRGLRAAVVFTAGVGVLAYTYQNRVVDAPKPEAASASAKLAAEMKDYGIGDDGVPKEHKK